ncbi:MAG: folate hydrolase, partial [Gammaproteobacteria bacterium]|nr:folate hydrolase [Gammaproteobacteria bacterium]
MRFITVALLALGFSAAFAADNIVGFDANGSAQQRALESALDMTIDAGEMDGWLKLMSETPHHVGSLASKENAEFVAELLTSWGYDTEIEGYQILLPMPRVREV